MKRLLMTSLSLAIAAVVTLSADNWPHWRGPAMNGTSTETGLPIKWSATENITWKLAMPGRSGSTPIIWGNTIFLNVGDRQQHRGSRAVGSGPEQRQVLWKRPIAGGNHIERKQNMSSPSPVTDGRRSGS